MMFAYKKTKKKRKDTNLTVKQARRFKNPRGTSCLPRRVFYPHAHTPVRIRFFLLSAVLPLALKRSHYRLRRSLLKKRGLRDRSLLRRRFLKMNLHQGRVNPFFYRLHRRRYCRFSRRNRRFFFRGHTHLTQPITRKPLQLRMGKGKGEIKRWFAPLGGGTPLWRFGFGRHAGFLYRLLVLFLKKLKRGVLLHFPQLWHKRIYYTWSQYLRTMPLTDLYYREIPRKAWLRARREQRRKLMRGW